MARSQETDGKTESKDKRRASAKAKPAREAKSKTKARAKSGRAARPEKGTTAAKAKSGDGKRARAKSSVGGAVKDRIERSRPIRDEESGRLAFPGISPLAYEHPADRAALSALRAVPGFDRLLAFSCRILGDRSLRLAFLASAVRVTERQFRSVHHRYREACRILDMDPPPELFVAQTAIVNAGAMGVGKPFIVLNSGSIGLLDGDELSFVLGHELGHVLSGHVLYKTMLRLLLRASLVFSSVPLGGAAVFAILAALLEWDRKSELSADRAGLLVVQSPEVAMRVQMKLAGGGSTEEMSMDEFAAQAEEYAGGGNVLDSVVKLLSLIGRTHPFPVLRLAEIRKWIESGGYQEILDGGYPLRGKEGAPSPADLFRGTMKSYGDDLETSKDPLARFLHDLGKRAHAAGESILATLRSARAGATPRKERRRK